MTGTPQDSSKPESPDTLNAEELLRSLRRKEGSWVEWGQACQALQKAGYNPQTIFEASGFEPIQQNQIIVAAQVYATMLAVGVSEPVKAHFGHKGSDILYELRILSQEDRAATAELAFDKQLDMDEVHEIARTVKEFARFRDLPDGFTRHPGDIVAHQAWKVAKKKADFQARSHLIARGLRFAHSASARQKIEQLLTDFSVAPSVPKPLLPIYRLDTEEDLPRILPVVGKLPLTKADLQAVPLIEETVPFRMVKFAGEGAWVAVPGWQVILGAADPVVILADNDALPTTVSGPSEEVLIVVDRATRTWDVSRYFLVEQGEHLQLQWFEQDPEIPLLGQMILVMRPKKVLDENYTKDPWQLDE